MGASKSWINPIVFKFLLYSDDSWFSNNVFEKQNIQYWAQQNQLAIWEGSLKKDLALACVEKDSG